MSAPCYTSISVLRKAVTQNPAAAGVLLAGWLVGMPATAAAGSPKPETLRAWDGYVAREEQRIEQELSDDEGFARGAWHRLGRGDIVIAARGETKGHGSGAAVQGGLIHHWLGAVLIPGATVDEVLSFVQDYDHHAPYFTEVLASKLLARSGDRFTISLRLERKKVITARYDTEHVVDYRRLGARAASVSRSTRIVELADVGTSREREKTANEDRGFLWRLNSYWRFDPRPEGVVLECESISLSREVPKGLGWLVNGFVKGISRESLERTLASIRNGVLSRRPARGTRS